MRWAGSQRVGNFIYGANLRSLLKTENLVLWPLRRRSDIYRAPELQNTAKWIEKKETK